MDYNGRLKWLQARMDEQDLEVAIYGSCSNFQYLTGMLLNWRLNDEPGYPGTNIFVPRTGDPILTVDSKGMNYAEDCWIEDVRHVQRISPRGSNYADVVKQVASDMD